MSARTRRRAVITTRPTRVATCANGLQQPQGVANLGVAGRGAATIPAWAPPGRGGDSTTRRRKVPSLVSASLALPKQRTLATTTAMVLWMHPTMFGGGKTTARRRATRNGENIL